MRFLPIQGIAFDNILLTELALRLIDVGVLALKSQVIAVLFEKQVITEYKN